MENQTRYDLNAAIENWRQELVALSSLTIDARRELEAHLRDAITGFQRRGLTDEESFWLARRRVGQPKQLGEEFVKANPAAIWRERLFWMVMAIFLSRTVGPLADSAMMVFMPMDPYSNTMGITLGAVWAISRLIPVALVIALARGKWAEGPFNLLQLGANRLRLGLAIVICVILTALINVGAASFSASLRGFHDSSNPVVVVFNTIVMPLSIGLFLLWLLPPQTKKSLKTV